MLISIMMHLVGKTGNVQFVLTYLFFDNNNNNNKKKVETEISLFVASRLNIKLVLLMN